MPTPLPSISLYYKEGTSDKEYHLEVIGNEEEGYKVDYRYGRRGGTLQCGSITKSKVDLITATKLFSEKVKKQQRGGYTTGEQGTPYQNTENAGKVSGVLPQLLNFIQESEVPKYLDDDDWVMQEKKDGVRKMIRQHAKVVEGINKKGIVTPIPKIIEHCIHKACGRVEAIIDGELVGEVYWLFDLLSIGVHAYSDKTYRERLEAIQEWLGDDFDDNFKMVPTAVGKSSKKALYKKLKEENAEGVVFRKLDSVYKAGRPHSGGSLVKFKFKTTATIRVKCLNEKNSFQMEMLSKGDWIDVGNCTYFPTVLIPEPGQFAEIEYLYVRGVGGSLYGPPVLLSIREDANEDDCLVSQLKEKQGTGEEDGIELVEEANV